MRIRFWGARGSLPVPGPSTLRYGGNTSCVEVETARGTLIVIDCGTGAYGLGQHLLATRKTRLRGHILISHTHWDHIQGVPFFAPLFAADTSWRIYAPKGMSQSLRDALAGQMQYTYFPVRLDELGAEISYHELVEGTLDIDGVSVSTRYLNHPALTFAYRIEADGAVLVYASDHEPHSHHMANGQGDLEGEDLKHCQFLTGADLVIHDAQYTAEEYPSRVGWGHSTIEYALAVCRQAGVKSLALTHHDPNRTDDAIDRMLEKARADLRHAGTDIKVFAAAEGETIFVEGEGACLPASSHPEPAIADASPAVQDPLLLLAATHQGVVDTLLDAASADAVRVVQAKDDHEVLRIVEDRSPSLIILEDGAVNIAKLCAKLKAMPGCGEIPIIVVAGSDRPESGNAVGATDWLIWPFSDAYARTRVRAWLLRTGARWERAPIPRDEQQRLADLYTLRILDTAREERFDRLTRLAAGLFGVPIALVSLIDRDRQWFKSAHGLNLDETPRETSFCAHAVASRDVLVVPDALADPRFAENPTVSGLHRFRFYAGYPLFVRDSCIGTLCVMDVRPRQLSSERLALLRDLAAMVEQELRQPQN